MPLLDGHPFEASKDPLEHIVLHQPGGECWQLRLTKEIFLEYEYATEL
jgi:hypothetical protein